MDQSKYFNVFSRKNIRFLFWIAGATFFLGLFAMFTNEMYEHDELDTIDRTILLFVEKLRRTSFNNAAVELTALGSPTIIFLATLIAALFLWLNRNRIGVVYLCFTSTGAGIWTFVLKHLIGRPRPQIIPHIVEVTGQSYPSGHSFAAASLYMGLMFLAFQSFKSVRDRVVLLLAALGLIFMISFSRVYLGVHYPSDVAAGVCLGFAWTLLLTGFFVWWRE